MTNQDQTIEPFYCKPASRKEEFEIAERLLANGVGFEGWISADERLNTIKADPGFCLIGVSPMGNLNRWKEHYDFIGASELSIQQVRELYPLSGEVKEDQTIYVTENKPEFVPEVGRECYIDIWEEGEWQDYPHKVRIDFISEYHVIVTTPDSPRKVQLHFKAGGIKFLPIKTEAEIKREAEIQKIDRAYSCACGYALISSECMSESLYKQGVRVVDEKLIEEAAKDKGYIKPRELSDEQIGDLWQKQWVRSGKGIHTFARAIEKHIKGEA